MVDAGSASCPRSRGTFVDDTRHAVRLSQHAPASTLESTVGANIAGSCVNGVLRACTPLFDPEHWPQEAVRGVIEQGLVLDAVPSAWKAQMRALQSATVPFHFHTWKRPSFSLGQLAITRLWGAGCFVSSEADGLSWRVRAPLPRMGWGHGLLELAAVAGRRLKLCHSTLHKTGLPTWKMPPHLLTTAVIRGMDTRCARRCEEKPPRALVKLLQRGRAHDSVWCGQMKPWQWSASLARVCAMRGINIDQCRSTTAAVALRLLRSGIDLIKDHDTRACVSRADAPPGATPASNEWYEECWKVCLCLRCGVVLCCWHLHVTWNHTHAASDAGNHTQAASDASAWSTVMLPGGGHAIGVDESKLRALPFFVLLGIVQRFRCVAAKTKAPLVRVVQYVDLPFAVTEKYAPMQVRAIKELVSQGKIGATFAQPSMDESVADAFSLVVQVLMSAFPRCLAC